MTTSNDNAEIFQDLREKLDRKTKLKQAELARRAGFASNLQQSDATLSLQLDSVLQRVTDHFALAQDLITIRVLRNMAGIEMEPGREHLVANGDEISVVHGKVRTAGSPNDIVIRIDPCGDGQLELYCLVCTAEGSIGGPGGRIRYVDDAGLLLPGWQDELVSHVAGLLMEQIKVEAEHEA